MKYLEEGSVDEHLLAADDVDAGGEIGDIVVGGSALDEHSVDAVDVARGVAGGFVAFYVIDARGRARAIDFQACA